jgi:uncharacterized membrane protein
LCRAPYAWLITSLVVLFMMTTSLSGIAKEVGDGSSFLAVAASALAVVDGFVAAFLVPRQLEAARSRLSAAQALLLRWAFALVPFLLTWAAVAAGAERWALSVGVILSTALLVQAARAARRVAA